MKIGGLHKQTLVDYPGEIAAMLFTTGCNFRCPYCQNSELILKKNKFDLNIDRIMTFLQERKDFLDAVVISGGEPTLHKDLPDFIKKIKQMGYLIKLDTNGSNLEMLNYLLKNKLLDYVAMDIKAPLKYENYKRTVQNITSREFWNVKMSINLLKTSSIKIEFRTTVVPFLHSVKDIINIAKYIKGARLYSLQQFNPQKTLNPTFAQIAPFSPQELNKIAEQCQPYVKQVRVLNIS